MVKDSIKSFFQKHISMQYEVVLRKMQTEFENPIAYYLVFPDDFIHMNLLLDRSLSIRCGKYEGLGCGADLPIFRQGYCKNCTYWLSL